MKWAESAYNPKNLRLPPRGGSGLKSAKAPISNRHNGLPPRGGSGLKLSFHSITNQGERLPPRGGSGLKCSHCNESDPEGKSPSAWREWIEIPYVAILHLALFVSLRVEGVD